ncbi:MAG: hypothetical protein ACRDRG_20705 [Pseudonocardiaceae bacterium]
MIEPLLSTCVTAHRSSASGLTLIVRAIVVSFGDQPPRVGVGQRFRISTGLPSVDENQTPPTPVQ